MYHTSNVTKMQLYFPLKQIEKTSDPFQSAKMESLCVFLYSSALKPNTAGSWRQTIKSENFLRPKNKLTEQGLNAQFHKTQTIAP